GDFSFRFTHQYPPSLWSQRIRSLVNGKVPSIWSTTPFQQRFHLQVVEVLKQYQRLVVYLEQDSNLLSVAEILTNIVLKTDKVMRAKFPALKQSSVEESVAYAEAISSGEKTHYYSAVEKTDRANSEFLTDFRPLSQEFVTEYAKYLSGLNGEITSNKPNKAFKSDS
ncbi:hypothetical protein, partial [Vibrio parahaemolyticus]|uniref:hypothetical protein n=1 Tax=Vibrio parahaemolyticus TaxID=670 RepID=UPI00235FA885